MLSICPMYDDVRKFLQSTGRSICDNRQLREGAIMQYRAEREPR